MRPNFTKEPGFTLLELAFVLVIIAAISGLSITFFEIQQNKASLTQTRGRQAAIIEAVAHFTRREGHVPCPAAPDNLATPGLARTSCTTSSDAEGLIPYQSLGLADRIAKDGYDRYMTYRVSPVLADSVLATMEDYCSTTSAASDTILQNDSGDSLSPNDIIAVTIISHGENGFGSFLVNGTNNKFNATDGSPDEDENADGDARLVDRPISTNTTDIFDDIVTWVGKRSLAAYFKTFVCTS